MTTPPRPARKLRPDYLAAVRPRETREEGRPRLSPTNPDILTIEHKVLLLTATGTDTTGLIASISKRRLRVIRIKVVQYVTDGKHAIEFFFGEAAAITVATRVIDILNVPDLGEDATRTYPTGQGPVGALNERISYRFKVAQAAYVNHSAIIEYTTER